MLDTNAVSKFGRERLLGTRLVVSTNHMDESFLEPTQSEEYTDPLEQLKFEMLLADLSASFVGLPADQIDGKIENAQQRICECLRIEHSSLWQHSETEPGTLLLTHLYRDPDLPPTPEKMDGDTYFPWAQQKLRKKEIVYLPNTADASPEAAVDKQTWLSVGVKSTLGFPLWAGDGPVFGVMSFDATTRARQWPEPLVRRLQLLGQVFANALARKRAEKSLSDSELRLRLAAASAEAGLWTLEVVTGRIWATDKTKEVFGITPSEEFDLKKFLSLVHEEDHEAVRRTIEAAVQSGEDRSIEYRIIRPDGETRWIYSRGRNGEIGEPDLLMGVSIDITERKRAEEVQLRHSAIIQSSDDAIISMDLNGIVTGWNPAAERIYGFLEREAIGQKIDFVIPPELRKEEELILARLGAGEQIDHFETARVRKDGSNVTVSLSISPIRNFAGRVIGASKIARDITEAKRAKAELQKSYAEVTLLKEKLQAESDYLQEVVLDIGRYHEIVGQSDALKEVLRKVEQVASTDTIVLITGETGTGKELIARAVHNLSKRKERVMVKVDCAALPPTLIESELFGREKGAYTGALSKQIGRFETAECSTLFLDEIGELGMESQAKLLRLVQDGEFERLGSSKTTHANVRLVAATNRDLAEQVKKGGFREDLFYRLNVFPIHVPPLRERVDDIPLLVASFLGEFEKKIGKKIHRVSNRSMGELKRYSWPGNIRELRNVIERAVILTTGGKLFLQLPASVSPVQPATLRETEHLHVLATLEKTGWRIKGPRGAASILGMKPSTLYTLMRRLRIPTRHEKGGIQS